MDSGVVLLVLPLGFLWFLFRMWSREADLDGMREKLESCQAELLAQCERANQAERERDRWKLAAQGLHLVCQIQRKGGAA